MAEPRISADVALQAPSQDEVGTNPRCLRVAVVTTYGSGHRFLYTISSNDNGAVVMTALREIVGASQHQVWLLRLLGKKPAIFQALVVLANHADAQAQGASCFVDTETLEYLPQHTAAFNNPDKFRNWVNFIQDNRIYYEVENEGVGAQMTLVRGWKQDPSSTAVLATILALFSIAVGVGAGVVWHNAAVGVGVSATAVGLLAFAAFVVAKLPR